VSQLAVVRKQAQMKGFSLIADKAERASAQSATAQKK